MTKNSFVAEVTFKLWYSDNPRAVLAEEQPYIT